MKLYDFPMWEQMQESELVELLDIVTVQTFQTQELLFRPGDDPNRLYLLYHGQVKTYVLSPQGHEKIMHIFSPGDAFGGLLLGVVGEGLPWAKAMSDVVVCIMGETGFKSFMQRCPNLCLALFRYMTAHHVQDMERLERILHTKASHRVVLTLLDLGHRLGYGDEEIFPIHPFTHEDIGNMIGVVRNTVTEVISQLRQVGVVSGRGAKMVVRRAVAEEYLQNDG